MRLTLLAAAAAGLTFVAAAGANAAPLTLLGAAATPNQSLATQVDWRDRCMHVRYECRSAFPGLGWRYRRCVVTRRC